MCISRTNCVVLETGCGTDSRGFCCCVVGFLKLLIRWGRSSDAPLHLAISPQQEHAKGRKEVLYAQSASVVISGQYTKGKQENIHGSMHMFMFDTGCSASVHSK